MTLNDTLKICLIVLLISLSGFIASSATFIAHRVFTPAKLEVRVDGDFFQNTDETVIQQEEPR
jgi:hypothetical protein